MIFYKKPKIYKDGRIRHGVVIIEGVKYTAELVPPLPGQLDNMIQKDGYVKIDPKGLLVKLTKIE